MAPDMSIVESEPLRLVRCSNLDAHVCAIIEYSIAYDYISKLQEENHRLALELHESEHRIARIEGDLRKVRNEELLKPEGTGEIDPELLSIIREGPIHDYKLLTALGVEPGSETSRGIAKQLQILEATGFISRTSQGWRWNR